uniref:Uncharacterized protein n=1 Tax=Nelumbo nucifera TaxID=4432 RepID=A0A822Z094_NELNU|nr:TPA_asm: hypothetical protein HUJ06_007546 [Nelumbo nucifera]
MHKEEGYVEDGGWIDCELSDDEEGSLMIGLEADRLEEMMEMVLLEEGLLNTSILFDIDYMVEDVTSDLKLSSRLTDRNIAEYSLDKRGDDLGQNEEETDQVWNKVQDIGSQVLMTELEMSHKSQGVCCKENNWQEGFLIVWFNLRRFGCPRILILYLRLFLLVFLLNQLQSLPMVWL